MPAARPVLARFSWIKASLLGVFLHFLPSMLVFINW
jgi:hypothetical protein